MEGSKNLQTNEECESSSGAAGKCAHANEECESLGMRQICGSKNCIKTGLDDLDRLIKIDSGIVTIRGQKASFLSRLASRAFAYAYQPGKRMLYLQWMDYHERYAPIDLDYMLNFAKKTGANRQDFSSMLMVLRSFGPDAVEKEGMWEGLMQRSERFSFIAVDSFSDLYAADKRKMEEKKPKVYVIGKLAQLSLNNSCPMLVLDSSRGEIHPYLAHRSNIIVELCTGAGFFARLIKHPAMADIEKEISLTPQKSLGSWVGAKPQARIYATIKEPIKAKKARAFQATLSRAW